MIARTLLLASLMTLVAAGADTGSDRVWWSVRPLERPRVPELRPDERETARSPVDAFVLAGLREHGLSASPAADRRTLIRRLSFDLLGLPPEPDEVEAFVADERPDAWERLVDRYLASPQLGERWARHWLDVVHYADTHGYDKDKLRPNAWPYRDYVVRALNDDRTYSRFVEEQIAGDVLFPGTSDGIVATGFIAAGPWDFIGHAEVPETKVDGRIARHLDRDDMVRATMQTFTSTTVGCARCHDHKFDPVSMEDYYSLQAIFAALDRADRPYDPSPEAARERRELKRRRDELVAGRRRIEEEVRRAAGSELETVEAEIARLRETAPSERPPAHGYHSAIEGRPDVEKWVQVDLGRLVSIERIVWVGCHDDFNGIGAGFGHPPRLRIAISEDGDFASGGTIVLDRTGEDIPNPGVAPQSVEVGGRSARWVRVTATRLAHRKDDYIFALAELLVIAGDGSNAARGREVTALDSIEAPIRWQRSNLVDGKYPGVSDEGHAARLAELTERRRSLIDGATDATARKTLAETGRELDAVEAALAKLPDQAMVFAGTVHTGSGAFRGTGHDGGRPREIRVLDRGDIRTPGEVVGPGTIDVGAGLAARFDLGEDHSEGARRRELARWITDRRNPLTWRSIVNRLWQYHVGRGIVETPNDFGRMGATPSHPGLLDWLAVELRDGNESLKRIHRTILTSSTYRQSTAHREEAAALDGGNRLLWRMNRRRLEAEAVRDATLAVSGRLDTRMGGPGFRCFVLEKPEHSPHYQYAKHDPDDPSTHRRSIYRFIVRSQPDPFMNTLDCADSSQLVATRNETLSPIQALTLLNDRFMVRAASWFATRLEREAPDIERRIDRAYRLALGRAPTADELAAMASYGREFGLENACRVMFNLNEFVFVD